MSAIVRSKRRRGLPGSTTALWLVLGLAVTFFLVRYGQELLLAHDLNERAAAQRVANGKLRDENTRLKALLGYYQSDKYIEQRAREDLNLRRRDEVVLIPVEATPEAATEGSALTLSDTQKVQSELAPAAARANWEKWLDLFSPAP
jgi:cell division protein FtsB